jgi:hypothetical protein
MYIYMCVCVLKCMYVNERVRTLVSVYMCVMRQAKLFYVAAASWASPIPLMRSALGGVPSPLLVRNYSAFTVPFMYCFHAELQNRHH